ncbi:serine/arginine-rich splicing factor 7-like [Ptychodera flava]|uniref:serine/arginine-rich splicing factor 7-like n=1 Tax=Ptychodera flava TaxID=63121 RepID=UPI003969D4C5
MSHWRDTCPLDCKVYVGDLGSGAAKHELERAFSHYGPLRNVWVARNPPGFAFVEFEDPRDASDSVRALDGRIICGRRVRVELSSGKTRRGRYVGRPPPPARRSYYDDRDRIEASTDTIDTEGTSPPTTTSSPTTSTYAAHAVQLLRHVPKMFNSTSTFDLRPITFTSTTSVFNIMQHLRACVSEFCDKPRHTATTTTTTTTTTPPALYNNYYCHLLFSINTAIINLNLSCKGALLKSKNRSILLKTSRSQSPRSRSRSPVHRRSRPRRSRSPRSPRSPRSRSRSGSRGRRSNDRKRSYSRERKSREKSHSPTPEAEESRNGDDSPVREVSGDED